MSAHFKTWKEAHNYAIELSNQLGREVGIEAVKTFEPGFQVHTLPKPHNRQGFELRLEIVSPGTPKSA